MGNQVRRILIYNREATGPWQVSYDTEHPLSIRNAKKLNRLLTKSRDVSHVEIQAEVW